MLLFCAHFWQISKSSVLDSETKKGCRFFQTAGKTQLPKRLIVGKDRAAGKVLAGKSVHSAFLWFVESKGKNASPPPFMKKAGYRFPEKVAVASEGNPAALYEKSWLRFSEKVAVGSERQSGSFLEQDSTAVPKFAFRSFCPCGNLVGECLPQTLPCGLRRLSRRSHAAVERRFYHAKTIQHTAPQPGSQNTHDRGRIRRVCPTAFCLQHEPSRVYPASHNRGSHTPHHNRFPRQ